MMRDYRMQVGTMNQQLQAVEDYLSIPADVRREYGEDAVWQYVYQRALRGQPTAMVDHDFRKLVQLMREAQHKVLASKRGTERELAVVQAREIEALVDKEIGQ